MAVGKDSSLFHQHNSPNFGDEFFEVMGDEDDGGACGKVAEGLEELRAGDKIEARRGLVENKAFRFRDQARAIQQRRVSPVDIVSSDWFARWPASTRSSAACPRSRIFVDTTLWTSTPYVPKRPLTARSRPVGSPRSGSLGSPETTPNTVRNSDWVHRS